MAAFEELVRRHTQRVFSVGYHITQSREDAEDVSQETFLKAYRHLKDFEGNAQFSTWLTRIAVNTALSTVARSNRARVAPNQQEPWELGALPENVPDWRENPEQLYTRFQLRQLLRQALEKLSPAYSNVFLLRDMQGFSISETAAALQLSIPTVKTRLLRARLQLRESLSKSFIPRGLRPNTRDRTWSPVFGPLVRQITCVSRECEPALAPQPTHGLIRRQWRQGK
jgi:RNA polymerase sigma-70 factor (ECF subfamily)